MKRPQLLLGLAFALCFAAPALADAPFGSLGVIGGNTNVSGVVSLHGWCLDNDDNIFAADIVVDGDVVGRARYGRQRPDVERAFPGLPDSAHAGFAFELDTTRFLNGLHFVQPRCTSRGGDVALARGKVLEFSNATHNLVPFGLIDHPNRNAQVFGNCDSEDPDRRYTVIEGWALDLGLEIGDTGVGYLELLIDGSIQWNTRRDCSFDEALGGLINCYGLERPDVEQRYPGVLDAPNSGFRFVLDIGRMIDQLGYTRGQHNLAIRAGDISGQQADIDEFPVVFLCDDDIENEGSFGRIGRPAEGAPLAGTEAVLGWALDWEGVDIVEISVDGTKVGEASHNGVRPGIANRYPGYPDRFSSGFGFVLDTTQFVNGPHQLQVHVIDLAVPARRTLIGERTFVVNN